MLPYRSLWSNVAYCFEMLPVKPGDHIVSMLPMGHVFGMVYDFLYGFSAGAHIYFLTRMPSPKIISQSFSEIKPKVISCVPLIVEKIIKKDILPKVDSKIGKLLLKVPIVNDKIKSLARQAAMEIFGGNFDEIIIGGAPLHHRLRYDGMWSDYLFQPLGNTETCFLRKGNQPNGSPHRLTGPENACRRNRMQRNEYDAGVL